MNVAGIKLNNTIRYPGEIPVYLIFLICMRSMPVDKLINDILNRIPHHLILAGIGRKALPIVPARTVRLVLFCPRLSVIWCRVKKSFSFKIYA